MDAKPAAVDPAANASADEETGRAEQAEVFTLAQLAERVHAQVAGQFGLRTSRDLDRDFGDSIAHWPAFPDTADALRYLDAVHVGHLDIRND